MVAGVPGPGYWSEQEVGTIYAGGKRLEDEVGFYFGSEGCRIECMYLE